MPQTSSQSTGWLQSSPAVALVCPRHSLSRPLLIPTLGIGLMMTKALALNGAHKVYIVGRRKDVLEQATKESPHGNIIPIVGDVTSKDSLQSVAAQIEKDTGYINVLIANSGTLGPQTASTTPQTSLEDYQSTLWNVPYEEYTQTFALNTSGVYFTMIAFLGLLDKGNKKGNVEQKSQIIGTSSIASFNRSAPGGLVYGQSKAATTLLMKQMATGLVPYDIRANILAPGCRLPSFSFVDIYSSPSTLLPVSRSAQPLIHFHRNTPPPLLSPY